MRKIILYGELGRRFGREHSFSVRTASEAIQACCVNFPGFRKFMGEAHKFGVGFKVFVGNSSLRAAKESLNPSAESETIRIAPAIFGSGGWARVIIGAVLVVAGAIMAPVAPGATATLWNYAGQMFLAVGVSMVLQGAAELIFPQTRPDMGKGGFGEGRQSFMFSGPQNTSQQGGPVPVGYGRMMVGSTVISAGIEEVDQ